MRFWDRIKAMVGEAMEALAETPSTPPVTPSTPTASTTHDPDYVWFGDQRGPTTREWERKLREHAARQEREAREEQEALRLAAERLQAELARAPLRALLPPSTAEPLTGVAGLMDYIREMVREGSRRP